MSKIKTKSKWICQECGYETVKYIGKCPDCGAWGTLTEEIEQAENISLNTKIFDNSEPACPINEVQLGNSVRFLTGFSEFDRTLGGGFVKGSITLLAGDPGIGKSTLLLQTSNKLAQDRKVLYVSAEESSTQIKLRAQRLGVNSENLMVYAQTNFDLIKQQTLEVMPEILIIDSIQAVYTQAITSSPGSVSQIRECTNELMMLAKTKNITVIVVGHVTKDGAIAGPKILEHIVDTVLYFEGDRYKSHRILRAIKNRFGSTSEAGIFNMEDDGMQEVLNPSEIFLHEREEGTTSGTVIIATKEGTRPVLIELQALVGQTTYPSPRRVVNGIDYNRLLQILAVLEKRIGLNLSKLDVYVNVTGGIDIDEPAADLGIALAVATCARDVVVSPDTVIIGEIGLSGEVRNVVNLETRIKESEKLGFKSVIIPYSSKLKQKDFKIKLIPVKRLMDAISACVYKDDKSV